MPMQIFYQQRRWFKVIIAAIMVYLVCNIQGLAQQGPPPREGVIRIKVTEALADRLEGKKFSKNFSGDVVTGVASLDKVNRQHKVKRFSRVFRHAGKNEARHRRYGLHLWYEVNMDKGGTVLQALKSFRSDTEILKAEAVYQKAIRGTARKRFGPVVKERIIKANSPALPNASNDPLLGSQWHYNNTGQTGGTPGADIRLFDGWKIETGNKNVIVAITDGGIQTNHPDLAANMWVNKEEIPGNNIDDDNNGYTDDIHGYSFVHNTGNIEPHDHGTHVGGTIGAVSNNGIGVAGVAGGSGAGDGVRLMSCAVFSYDGYDGFPEAYIYAADNGAVISQNSWGYTYPGVYEQSVLDAIDYFIAEAGKDENGNQIGPMKGGIVIFSAGNNNDEVDYYPGFYPPVLAVASSTHQDKKALYSNYGSWVDITAPGGETYDTDEQGVISTLTGSQYGSFMGTSMACPHVSGVAGLIVSKFGGEGFSAEALRKRLIHSVNNVDAVNPDYTGKLGLGRINTALAVSQSDRSAPRAINNLSVAYIDIGKITLSWTSPQDESGFVTGYDIRYSTSPITAANFNAATPAKDVPAPGPTGTVDTFTVNGLRGGTEFYFAIKSQDFEENISAISNVVKETSALAPAIVITPVSLTENLQTAEISKKTFTINNTGEGPLEFTLIPAEGENNFASALPEEGIIAPGNNKLVSVSFDAKGLLAGTYQQSITIWNNDPERNTVMVPLTLKVTNNNAPIASVMPKNIDFKSAQIGTTVSRPVTITNEGSDPLIIHEVTSTHQAFGANFQGDIHINAFAEAVLNLTYSPESTGFSSGEISIHTNDPANGIFKIPVKGEGLNEPPLVVSPDSFEETLDQRTRVTRALVLQNNGSQDRTFRLEIADTEVVMPQTPEATGNYKLSVATADSTAARFARMRAKHEARLAEKTGDVPSLLTPIGQNNSGQSKNDPATKSLLSGEEMIQYKTGFEDFTLGPISNQQNWFGTQGWTISSENPDTGSQHFRGTSVVSGSGEKFALSPYILPVEEYPHFTSVSMRINADNAKGASWQIITQDDAFIGVRIRFNPDGSMDALVIDNEYETHWRRLPDPAPSGYFDLAIEYNNWGSDTSGFPTYLLFINNHHVFSGASIGFAMGQIVVASRMETSGPTLDIDNFHHWASEYYPRFIKPSMNEGTIPAGQSVQVDLEFNGDMRFGTYRSPVVIHMDETDSVIVPIALSVIGESSMVVYPDRYIYMEGFGEVPTDQRILMNTGGRSIQFNFKYDLPGLSVEPKEGTLDVRENLNVTIKFEGPPGIYQDQIELHTDIKYRPMEEIFVNIVILDTGAIFAAPTEEHFEIRAGEFSTRKVQLRNDGKNTVSFRAGLPFGLPWVSLDPVEATISDEPVDLIITFDARNVSAGLKSFWINFHTNDMNRRYHRTNLTVNVLPDSVRRGKIVREVWTGVTGNNVSSIPVENIPSNSSVLRLFESPANTGDNYGSRIRGYVLAPLRGYYTFWIASNDHSELWLSLDNNPQNKQKIASVTSSTNPRQWDKFATQKSQAIFLEQNQKVYIEALHKEGVGTDHLSVGWEIPGKTLERPIPGSRLIPYGMEETNEPPQVSLITPSEGEIFSAPATIEITADALEEDGNIVKVEFFNGTSKLGTDISAPFTFSWKNVASGNYTLIAKATDNRGATDSASVSISVTSGSSCAAAGKIQRELWTGIQGNGIEKIPLNSPPAAISDLTTFEGPANSGDHYGARIRGYLCVPETGDYYFWIASNDNSALWLSTDDNPANKVKIASVSSHTNPRQWDKFTSQRSPVMHLVAGHRYYIEALHKEGVGTDHIAVGWQLPGGTLERPLPGSRLIPFGTPGNQSPVVSITDPANGQTYSAPTAIDIAADASDSDGTISKVVFYNGTVKLGEDKSAPYNFTWSNVSAGDYVLTTTATDNQGAVATSGAVNISVTDICRASGTIAREVWSGISGNNVASIPVNTTPDHTEGLAIFEGPANAGTNYGARIRGYLCAPATGNYTFWISSNDHSELWLSTDDNPGNKIKIAFLTSATGSRQWEKFSTQRSAPISMTQGKRYYIEALHKQGIGTDNLAVGWQLPDGLMERPIPGTRLSPVGLPSAAFASKGISTAAAKSTLVAEHINQQTAVTLSVYPNPAGKGTITLTIEGFAGTERTSDEAKVEIRNMTGLSVYSNTLTCKGDCVTEIAMDENFTSGVYIIQVKLDNTTFSKKLVVH